VVGLRLSSWRGRLYPVSTPCLIRKYKAGITV
jgi:hypothetical protein